jgi:hypothetical protein
MSRWIRFVDLLLELIMLTLDRYMIIGFIDLKSSILREVSACPLGLKAALFRLAQILLEDSVCRSITLDHKNTPCILILTMKTLATYKSLV